MEMTQKINVEEPKSKWHACLGSYTLGEWKAKSLNANINGMQGGNYLGNKTIAYHYLNSTSKPDLARPPLRINVRPQDAE